MERSLNARIGGGKLEIRRFVIQVGRNMLNVNINLIGFNTDNIRRPSKFNINSCRFSTREVTQRFGLWCSHSLTYISNEETTKTLTNHYILTILKIFPKQKFIQLSMYLAHVLAFTLMPTFEMKIHYYVCIFKPNVEIYFVTVK